MTYILFFAIGGIGQAAPGLDFPPLGLYKHACPIETKYDRFKDESVYNVNVGTVAAGRGRPAFTLWVQQRFRGSERKPVDAGTRVDIIVSAAWTTVREALAIASTLDIRDDRGSEFAFLFEKGRINPPPSPVVDEDRVYSMTVSIPVQDFLRMASSDWIECRVGRAEYRLSTFQRDGLRDYASRMALDDRTVKAKLDALEEARKDGEGKPEPPRRGGEDQPDARARPGQAARPRPGPAATRLRRAQELEAAAITAYKEIVERNPGTPEADTAAERLQVLQPGQPPRRRGK
jgi:hypothetical protein